MVNWKKLKKFVQKVAKPVAAIAAIVYPPLIPMIGSAIAGAGASAAVVAATGAAALSAGASVVAGDKPEDILKNAALAGITAGTISKVSGASTAAADSAAAAGSNASSAYYTPPATAALPSTAGAGAATGLFDSSSYTQPITTSSEGLISPVSAPSAAVATTPSNLGVSTVGAAPTTTSSGYGYTTPAGEFMGPIAPTDTGIMSKLAGYGSGVVDFAKANPQLAGSLLGALGGAVSAANAPKEQTTTTSIDPDIKREYMANLERAKTAAANLGVRQFADFTGDYGLAEAQLKNLGLGGKGQQTTDEAARLAMIEAGFTPQQIAAAQANRGAVQDVTGQLGSQYMGAYFNPYEEQVVQGTLGDIERSRMMQDVADRARATQARAFGGSRQGVQSALTNEAALRQAGTTAAGLRQAGFAQAAQFGQSDAARQLQAQMANQGVSLTLEQANAQLRQQAALANQQAGISGAGLRQSAISQLGQLGAQQQNLGLTGANAVMLAQMERQKLDQQRLDAQRNLELERLGITGGALGLQPARTGETSTQPLYNSTVGSALSGGLTGAYIGSLLQPKPV